MCNFIPVSKVSHLGLILEFTKLPKFLYHFCTILIRRLPDFQNWTQFIPCGEQPDKWFPEMERTGSSRNITRLQNSWPREKKVKQSMHRTSTPITRPQTKVKIHGKISASAKQNNSSETYLMLVMRNPNHTVRQRGKTPLLAVTGAKNISAEKNIWRCWQTRWSP